MAIEYMVDWALEADGETIAHTLGPVEEAGAQSMSEVFGAGLDAFVEMARTISCPVLVLQGELDSVTPPSWGEALAKETGGRYHLLPATSHTVGRKPVPINLALREFAQPDEREAQMPDPTVHRSDDSRKRALFVSSPIGLGHAQRDLAIADELRQLQSRPPDRLARPGPGHARARSARASDPSRERMARHESRALRVRGGRARPALLPGAAADGRDPGRQLHAVPRRGRARSATTSWIGDEAWDVDYYWHENPELKRAPTCG